jgi:hypothetical protein
MDAKGWQSWTGTSGTSANPTITSSVTGVHGATLDATDPAGQAKTKLNTYVTANSPYTGTVLMTWIDGGLYPKQGTTGPSTSLANKNELNIEYSLNNGQVTIKNIDEMKHLKIYSSLGKLMSNTYINGNYTISLKNGIYIIDLEGKAPQKILVY